MIVTLIARYLRPNVAVGLRMKIDEAHRPAVCYVLFVREREKEREIGPYTERVSSLYVGRLGCFTVTICRGYLAGAEHCTHSSRLLVLPVEYICRCRPLFFFFTLQVA